MAIRRESTIRNPQSPMLLPWWAPMMCVAGVLWLMLWAGINTGPWVFRRTPEGLREGVHYVRTALPLAVLAAAPLVGWTGYRRRRRKPSPRRGTVVAKRPFAPAAKNRSAVPASSAGLPGPLLLWLLYGLVGFGASALSPRPPDAAYWGACYLAVFAALAAYLRGGDPLRRAAELNWLTWAAVTGILAILCVVARHVLSSAVQGDMSAYNVMSATGGSVGGMAMSRSTGMARFAAVPAVLAYVMLWRDKRLLRRVFWASLFAAACLLIYMMQARGTTFSLVFALAAATYALGMRARVVGAAVLVVGALAVAAEVVPRETLGGVATHVTRGDSVDEMRGMTGRLRDWERSRPHVAASPVVGHGFQADRFLGFAVGGHIHNTYLYALLTAGGVGLGLFLAGLTWTWIAAWQLMRRATREQMGTSAMFAQSVGILAFFTMRSIPEVSGALFAVDLMVMVPAMAYLALLARQRGERMGPLQDRKSEIGSRRTDRSPSPADNGRLTTRP